MKLRHRVSRLETISEASDESLEEGNEPEQEVHDSETEQQEFPHLVLPRVVSSALYITDLDPNFATQGVLFDLFSQVGAVMSVRVCTNPKSPLLCHAYVNFSTVEEACLAWQTLNYKDVNGMPMRILFSNLDPASRYNHNANLIIKNLEESIDSEALHHTFSAIGVVLSCKVEQDSSTRKSLGYGFIQFQDEEDAQRAIELVNGKLIKGKQVYLGPFIPRSVDRLQTAMNLNPLDLNPAHIPEEDEDEDDCNEELPRREDKRRKLTSSSENDRVRSRQRAAEMIEAARAAIIAQKRAEMPHIDPTYVPSSEAWPPQPWSVETLRAKLASAHLPEERTAMLNATLLPLVWKTTIRLSADVMSELVKMDDEEIAHLMESDDALRAKVKKIVKMILQKILDQAPYVPKAEDRPRASGEAFAPGEGLGSTSDQALADPGEDAVPAGVVPLLPVREGTGVFQVGKLPRLQKPGTGFFDVSRTQPFWKSKVQDGLHRVVLLS